MNVDWTRLDVWPEMAPIWHLFHSILSAGRMAIEEGGAFVKAAMTTGTPLIYRTWARTEANR